MYKKYHCANCGATPVEGSTLCVDCLAACDLRTPEDPKEMEKRKNSTIEALKASNEERQKIIDLLVTNEVDKNWEIANLMKQIEVYRDIIRSRENY